MIRIRKAIEPQTKRVMAEFNVRLGYGDRFCDVFRDMRANGLQRYFRITLLDSEIVTKNEIMHIEKKIGRLL